MNITKQQILEMTASRLRAIYCEERSRWHLVQEGRKVKWGDRAIPQFDGGEGPGGKNYANVWERAATLVYLHRLSPRRLVQALFDKRSAKPPLPTHLLGDAVRSRYEALFSKESSDILRTFQAQKETLKLGLFLVSPLKQRSNFNDDDLLRVVLLDLTARLSALFRYCLAVDRGLDSVSSAFLQDALEQYISYPDSYDLIWRGWIPDSFRATARDLMEGRYGSDDLDHEAPTRLVHQRAIIID